MTKKIEKLVQTRDQITGAVTGLMKNHAEDINTALMNLPDEESLNLGISVKILPESSSANKISVNLSFSTGKIKATWEGHTDEKQLSLVDGKK